MDKMDKKKLMELANRLGEFVKKLNTEGYNNPMSVVLILGDGDGKSVYTMPLIDAQFVQPTMIALDNFIANVKVHGIPNPKDASILDMSGEQVKTYEGADAEEFLKGEISKDIVSLLNKMYKEIPDKKELRTRVLEGLVISICKGAGDDWHKMDADTKMTILAEAIMHLKDEYKMELLETDYTDAELQNAINKIDHIVKFGYIPADNKDMDGYA